MVDVLHSMHDHAWMHISGKYTVPKTVDQAAGNLIYQHECWQKGSSSGVRLACVQLDDTQMQAGCISTLTFVGKRVKFHPVPN